jgi:hypothetical protein
MKTSVDHWDRRTESLHPRQYRIDVDTRPARRTFLGSGGCCAHAGMASSTTRCLLAVEHSRIGAERWVHRACRCARCSRCTPTAPTLRPEGRRRSRSRCGPHSAPGLLAWNCKNKSVGCVFHRWKSNLNLPKGENEYACEYLGVPGVGNIGTAEGRERVLLARARVCRLP